MSKILDQLAHIADLSGQEKANLTADVAAGVSAVTVDSTQGLAADDYVIIGNVGENGTEMVQVNAISSVTQFTTKSALAYGHNDRDPIVKTPYNQVKIYSSTTETGTFAQIAAGSPAAMEVDQYYTYIVDSAGAASTWYKFSWYNSTSLVESSLSAAYLGGKQNQIISLDEAKKWLDIKEDNVENDQKLLQAIIQATGEIIKHTGVQFISKSVSSEAHDISDNQDTVNPKYYPVYSTPTVVENGTTLTYNSDPDVTEFNWYPDSVTKAAGNFISGARRVVISYTAYEPPPEDIKFVCAEIAGIRAGLKIRTFVDGEGITQAVLLRNMPKDITDILDRYRRVVL